MLSCTDTKQSWGVKAKARSDLLYAPKPIKDMCCVKKNAVPFVSPTAEEDRQFEENVLKSKFSSAGRLSLYPIVAAVP